MRIAFIVGSVFPAISETFIVNQITGLIKRGYTVDIYAEKPEISIQPHPEVIQYNLLARTYYHQVPKNYLLRLLKGSQLLINGLRSKPIAALNLLNLSKYGRQSTSLRLLYQGFPHLDKAPYDIVHCHFGYNGIKSLQLRDLGLLQGKLITTFHGLDLSQDIQTQGDHIYSGLFKQGDLFLPVSEHWKYRLVELGCDEKKILVHRMGIDRSSFPFIYRGLSSTKKVQILSVSRLIEKKGIEYGIRAIAELTKAQSNLSEKVEYNIIGDGPLKHELRQLIDNLKVGHLVKLLGWKQKPDVIGKLKDADIFLSPSVTSQNGDQEGIPVALMEAMAMGLPVVSTLHSGIPELVSNNVSGYLVPERSVQALANKLNDLIEHPETRSKMGWSGYQYVEKYYDIEKLNDQLVERYCELVSPRKDKTAIAR